MFSRGSIFCLVWAVANQLLAAALTCSSGNTSPCSATGPSSTVQVIAGQDSNFSVSLSCPWSRIGWSARPTSPFCNILYVWTSSGVDYTLRCNSGLPSGYQGSITTEWCDTNGRHQSLTTQFNVSVAGNPPPPEELGPNGACRKTRASTCQVEGPSQVTVNPNQVYTFNVTLLCPAASSAQWTSSSWNAVPDGYYPYRSNPAIITYTITTNSQSQGAAGYWFTEWCDTQGGYKNSTIRFSVSGSSTAARTAARTADTRAPPRGSASQNA